MTGETGTCSVPPTSSVGVLHDFLARKLKMSRLDWALVSLEGLLWPNCHDEEPPWKYLVEYSTSPMKGADLQTCEYQE